MHTIVDEIKIYFKGLYAVEGLKNEVFYDVFVDTAFIY